MTILIFDVLGFNNDHEADLCDGKCPPE